MKNKNLLQIIIEIVLIFVSITLSLIYIGILCFNANSKALVDIKVSPSITIASKCPGSIFFSSLSLYL